MAGHGLCRTRHKYIPVGSAMAIHGHRRSAIGHAQPRSIVVSRCWLNPGEGSFTPHSLTSSAVQDFDAGRVRTYCLAAPKTVTRGTLVSARLVRWHRASFSRFKATQMSLAKPEAGPGGPSIAMDGYRRAYRDVLAACPPGPASGTASHRTSRHGFNEEPEPLHQPRLPRNVTSNRAEHRNAHAWQ